MSYFDKKRFTMRQVVGLLIIVFLGITAAAYAVNITYAFTSGSPIKASEMNQNFADVKNAVDALEAKDAGLITPGDLNSLVGKKFGGTNSGWNMLITFTSNTELDILLYDGNLSQATYKCKYNIGTGFISLYSCDYGSGFAPGMGVLSEVKIQTITINSKPYKTISGLSLLGNSMMNTQLPYLSHFYFGLGEQ